LGYLVDTPRHSQDTNKQKKHRARKTTNDDKCSPNNASVDAPVENIKQYSVENLSQFGRHF